MQLLQDSPFYKPSEFDQYSLVLAIEENQIPEVIFRLSQAHIALTTVQPHYTNLEDIYLSITKGGKVIE